MQTWEMIKHLTENPKLKFEYDTGSEQGIVGVVDGNISVISCNNRPENSYLKLHSGFMKINWKLIKEPVPWQEAIQAWRDNKNFYVIVDEIKYMQCENECLGFFQFRRPPSGCLEIQNGFFTRMFDNGEWYIEN